MDIKGVHELYQLHATQSAGRSAKRVTEETAVSIPAAANVDVIQISPEASLRAKLDTLAKSQKSEGGFSAQRLESLRRSYGGDGCPVSGADVAQVLLSRMGGAVPEAQVAR